MLKRKFGLAKTKFKVTATKFCEIPYSIQNVQKGKKLRNSVLTEFGTPKLGCFATILIRQLIVSTYSTFYVIAYSYVCAQLTQ
jgi:hypothetical protein